MDEEEDDDKRLEILIELKGDLYHLEVIAQTTPPPREYPDVHNNSYHDTMEEALRDAERQLKTIIKRIAPPPANNQLG